MVTEMLLPCVYSCEKELQLIERDMTKKLSNEDSKDYSHCNVFFAFTANL